MNYQKYLILRQVILHNLDSRGKWGAAHTSFTRMLKKIPRHDRGVKETKKAVSDLIKEGKILLKRTLEEDHVSLNPRLTKEIKAEELNEYSPEKVYQTSKNKHLNR